MRAQRVTHVFTRSIEVAEGRSAGPLDGTNENAAGPGAVSRTGGALRNRKTRRQSPAASPHTVSTNSRLTT
jgi:hypothetical protein